MILKKPELLSPAGGLASLRAAVEAGCDAVYMGGSRFNARYSAENFTDSLLSDSIDYAHSRGVRVYITVNTLYTNGELREALSFAAHMAEAGADAFIVQDIGFASKFKELYPECALHASTQMTAKSAADAFFLRKWGFDRVVPARECTLEEIKAICAVGIETEVFVHGAMCMCYSGQCLMSAFLDKNGIRSGNRGQCAQPCRLPYTMKADGDDGKNKVSAKGYLLSPKDLMALRLLPHLINAGVTAFKIEGRMKSPEYVNAVTRTYRKILDQKIAPEPEDEQRLLQVFNRGGGFTEGFFSGVNVNTPESMSVDNPKNTGVLAGRVCDFNRKTGRCSIKTDVPLIPGDGLAVRTAKGIFLREDICGTFVTRAAKPGEIYAFTVRDSAYTPSPGDEVYKTFDKKTDDELKAQNTRDTREINVQARVLIEENKPSVLTLIYTRHDGKTVKVTAEGEIPQAAQNQPLETKELINRLSKTGGTGVRLSFDENSITLQHGLYIPVSALNRLRRNAVEELIKAVVLSYKREYREAECTNSGSYKNKIERKEIFSDNTRKGLTVQCESVTQMETALAAGAGNISCVYMNMAVLLDSNKFMQCKLLCEKSGALLYAALPQARIDDRRDADEINSLINKGISGFLARTWGQLMLLRDTRVYKTADYTLHMFNAAALDSLREWSGITTLSPELFLPGIFKKEELSWIGGDCEIILYGRLPWMITRRCLLKLYGKCAKANQEDKQLNIRLIDRVGAEYPVKTGCSVNEGCSTKIFAHEPINYLNNEKILPLPFGTARLIFTVEKPKEISYLINRFLGMESTLVPR